MSTPTKLRRSISTGDVSVNPSPILRSKGVMNEATKEAPENTELEGLQARISELELQLEDAQCKLSAKQESREEEMKQRIEQLEAEMETYKAELKLREQEREESEKLAEQLNTLQVRVVVVDIRNILPFLICVAAVRLRLHPEERERPAEPGHKDSGGGAFEIQRREG